jgi:hypothetical protein
MCSFMASKHHDQRVEKYYNLFVSTLSRCFIYLFTSADLEQKLVIGVGMQVSVKKTLACYDVGI